MLKIRNLHAKSQYWCKNITERFSKHLNSFEKLFRSGNHKLDTHALQYSKGLVQAPTKKRNIERMEESVQGMSYDPIQGFISDSTWDHEPVQAEIGNEANRLFQGRADISLLIDETGIEKKGKKSAGVAKQYNGRLGKVDNCQVGVFTALCCKNEVVPIGAKLFLPNEWTEDKDRCEHAKIPDDQQIYKTKPQLALDLVDFHIQNGVKFHWVQADGLYGNSQEFLRGLNDRSLHFVVDVHSDQKLYLQNPDPKIPDPVSATGRAPSLYRSDSKPIGANKIVETHDKSAWTVLKLRKITKGNLIVEALCLDIWAWDGKEPSAHQWKLVITRNPKTKKDVKYSLSNAGEDTSLKRMAYIQRQRYWIENAFKEAKSTCGLADYQVRSWIAWHHHVTMVMLTCLFMVKEKRAAPESIHLISGYDIREMLMYFLPQRKADPDEIFLQMMARHRKRQRDVELAEIRQAREKWES